MPLKVKAHLFLAILCFAGVFPLQAKRAAPQEPESVVIGHVRYSAPADPVSMGFVVATEVASDRELWRQRIYRVPMNPALETDVQWVFITALKPQGQALLITNERGARFLLDLSTRRVRPAE